MAGERKEAKEGHTSKQTTSPAHPDLLHPIATRLPALDPAAPHPELPFHRRAETAEYTDAFPEPANGPFKSIFLEGYHEEESNACRVCGQGVCWSIPKHLRRQPLGKLHLLSHETASGLSKICRA